MRPAAPGEQILMLDLNNGYTTQDGTSFAAPHPGLLADALDRSRHVTQKDTAFMETHCRAIYERCRKNALCL